MRKLVIGCGYLGERVARAWQQQGSEVFALTRSTETAERFRSLGIVPIVGDVMQPETLIFPDEIATCLYAVGLDRSAAFRSEKCTSAGYGTYCTRDSFSSARLIYISSTSVYGQEDGSWVDETSPTIPDRENGRVCVAAEELIRSQSKSAGQRDSSLGNLRSRSSARPHRSTQAAGADPGKCRGVVESDSCGGCLPVRCSPVKSRDETEETYLVSDDRPVLRREYYSRLAELASAPPPEFRPDSVGLGKRCRNAKTRSELGFAPRYPTIEQGLPPLFADRPPTV
jgi:nucleoside-diphosphate-sugar epimerase